MFSFINELKEFRPQLKLGIAVVSTDPLGMGESNCAWNRRTLLHRDTMLAAAAVYKGEVVSQQQHTLHYTTTTHNEQTPSCSRGNPVTSAVQPFVWENTWNVFLQLMQRFQQEPFFSGCWDSGALKSPSIETLSGFCRTRPKLSRTDVLREAEQLEEVWPHASC